MFCCAGYSLPQPHLERTHLCKLNDSQLEPAYVRQRDRLNELVHQLARPKVVGNQAFTGAQLADLIKSLVNALNAKEIPTAASLIESFNSELINKAMQEYNHDMDTIKLPIDEQELEKVIGLVVRLGLYHHHQCAKSDHTEQQFASVMQSMH